MFCCGELCFLGAYTSSLLPLSPLVNPERNGQSIPLPVPCISLGAIRRSTGIAVSLSLQLSQTVRALLQTALLARSSYLAPTLRLCCVSLVAALRLSAPSVLSPPTESLLFLRCNGRTRHGGDGFPAIHRVYNREPRTGQVTIRSLEPPMHQTRHRSRCSLKSL
jgi:hypothetical protein